MDDVQHTQWLNQVRATWAQRDTEELLAVWKQNNRQEWTDGTFEVISEILIERIGNVPLQGEVSPVSAAKTRSKRSTLLLAAIILILVTYFIISRLNSNIQVVQDETQTITLTQSIDLKRLVYENDIVLVSIGYDQFLDYIEAQLNKYKDDKTTQAEYVKWRNTVEAQLRNNDVLILDTQDDEYLVAHMLETGKASVFDKRSQSYVETINKREYGYICGALCGSGYRYFYLPDRNLFNPNGTQFLKIMIWIS